MSLAVAVPALPASGVALDERSRARALLLEGSKLLESADYADALARFETAYQLVPSPKIFYNVGLAYLGLNRPSDAMRSFERFVAEASDAPPANLAKAREYLGTLAKKVTVVELTGDLEGAEVFVDGRLLPLGPRLIVDPGTHQLMVEKRGKAPFLRRFTGRSDERIVIAVRLPETPMIGMEPGAVERRNDSVTSARSPGGAVTGTGSDLPATGQPPPRSSWQRTTGWVLSGVAATFLAAGTAARLAANAKYDEFNTTEVKADPARQPTPIPEGTTCNKQIKPDAGSPKCQSLLSRGDTYATLSWAGFIGGGILAGTAIVFFALPTTSASQASSAGQRLSCAPAAVGDLGAACSVTF